MRNLINLFPVDRILSPFFRGSGSVLMFHRVLPSERRAKIQGLRGLEVSIQYFNDVLDYFTQSGYVWISLDELDYDLKQGTLKKKFACITFDDGYRDNFEIVLPLLARRKIPFTIFLTTFFAEKKMFPWWYALEDLLIQKRPKTLTLLDSNDTVNLSTYAHAEIEKIYNQLSLKIRHQNLDENFQQRLLTWFRRYGVEPETYANLQYAWDEIKSAMDPVLTIGAHTVSHRPLSLLSKEDALDEIRAGRLDIEAKLNVPVKFFAYPFGSADSCGPREFLLARDENFSLAFTTRYGHIFEQHRHFRHVLPRINVSGHLATIRDLEMRMNGLTQILHQRGQRFVTN